MRQAVKPIFRVVLFWGIFGLLLFGLQVFPPFLPKDWTHLFMGGLLAGCSLLLVTIFLRFEHKKLSIIGLKWGSGSLHRMFLGILSGMAIVGLMLYTITIFSSIAVERVSSPDYWNSIGYAALVLFFFALMEEVIFRSYPLVRLSESVGARTSIYITAIVFAFYHGLDPKNLLGPGVWGLFFGLAAIKTKGIAFPTGFHFGLNWMQSLLGMKPQYASSIWTVAPGGNGGIFSFEAVGLGLQIILLVLGVIFIEISVRQQKVQIKQQGIFAL